MQTPRSRKDLCLHVQVAYTTRLATFKFWVKVLPFGQDRRAHQADPVDQQDPEKQIISQS